MCVLQPRKSEDDDCIVIAKKKQKTNKYSSSSSSQELQIKIPCPIEFKEGGFGCNDCNKRFVQNCHYRRHWRDTHSGQEPKHICIFCRKKFRQKQNLISQMFTHWPDELRPKV